MDRAFRNLFDLTHLLQMFDAKGIGFLSLDVALDTATPLGKFVIQLMGSVAELERHWIRQRTKEALAVRQEKGLPHGGRPPAGWKKNSAGQWDWDTAERRLIERALAVAEGNRTHAARALGISRRALLYKIKRLGVEA
jgi:DNA invertase Pin-like site-specific DNA recombinase